MKAYLELLRTELYQQIVVPEVLSLGTCFHVTVDGAISTYLTGVRDDAD